jgi:septum site-determining protein MinC
MNTSNSTVDLEPSFRLKGGRVTITTLELYNYEYSSFTEQLAETVQSAPDFFRQTPVILSLEKCQQIGFIDFIELGELCREYGLVPVAVRGGNEEQTLSANVAGLPTLPPAREKLDVPAASEPVIQEHVEIPILQTSSNRLITQPIRSGQQIYAPGGDLIVIAPVSAGAEILADGNIHVYGPLRGRALAGVKGDTEARIFCQSLEAELISIAGHYKVNEDLRSQNWKQAAHAQLIEDQLIITALL